MRFSPTAARTVKPYFSHIDGLRAVAVLGVLWNHLSIPGLPGGFLGVDVFFVISGYLITRLIFIEKQETGGFDYLRFYLRRVRRLAPAALTIIAVSLVAFYPILGDKDLISFLRSIPFAILPVANVNFYNEVGYFDTSASLKPLLHFWSLGVEEQYYFLWPTILVLLMATRRMLLPMTLTLLLISLLSAEVFRTGDPSAVFYLLPFRAVELLVGSALALVFVQTVQEKVTLPAWKGIAATFGLVAVLSSFLMLDETSPMPGLLSLPLCIGTALLIAYGSAGPVRTFLTLPPMIWIGKISYSLYLVHWPLIVYFTYRLPGEPPLWFKLTLAALSILLAALSYYLVESTLRRPALKGTRRGNVPFLLSMLALACSLVLPTAIYSVNRAQPTTQHISMPDKVYDATQQSVPFPGSPDKLKMVRLKTQAPSAPKVLVIGDSHAGHLLNGLRYYLAPQGIDVDLASIPACPPLFGVSVVLEDNGQPSAECSRHALAKQSLMLAGDYDVVILVARWNTSVGPRSLAGINLRQNPLISAFGGETATSLDASRMLFQKALGTTLTQLHGAGKKVIVFGQVPTTGSNLTQCQSLFSWAEQLVPEGNRCVRLTLEEVRQRGAFADNVLRSAGDGVQTLSVIPSDFLCNKTECPLTAPVTGEFLYRDAHHLSSAGSIHILAAADASSDLTAFIRSASTN